MNDAPRPPDIEPEIRIVAMPADANPSGDIFGGWIMSMMDMAGGTLAYQRGKLVEYRWVDQEKQIVSIPIERAMELVVEELASPASGDGSPTEGVRGRFASRRVNTPFRCRRPKGYPVTACRYPERLLERQV